MHSMFPSAVIPVYSFMGIPAGKDDAEVDECPSLEFSSRRIMAKNSFFR